MEFPTWFPWMLVGGFAFMTLSFIASKYNQRTHPSKAFAQDFLSGSILVALMGVLVPDYFPSFPISSDEIPSLSLQNLSSSSDFDLQVGPIRR